MRASGQRFALAVVMLIATCLIAGPVRAQQPGELQACFDAFGEAQRLRRDAELLASQRELLACSRPTCPGAIVDKCVGWLAEVKRDTPSIVVTATAPDGRDAVDVRVTVDGQLLRESLDGTPIPLDPGPHELALELAGGGTQRQTIMLAVGQKQRAVHVSFAPAAPPQPLTYPLTHPLAQPPAPSPASEHTTADAPWLLGVGIASTALGGASLVAGIVTGALALDREAELGERCPNAFCTSEEDRAIHGDGVTLARASTVTLIGGVALVVAGVAVLVIDAIADEPMDPDDTIGQLLRGRF